MARRASSTLSVLGLAVLVGGVLAGCATGTAVDPGSDGQEVPGGGATTEIDVDAAWLDSGRMIGLITEGSSTCVPVAEEVTLESDGTLAVVLNEGDETTPCTADYAPRVTLVDVPEGVDPTKDLEISVTGAGFEGDTELDGVPGLDATVGVGDYLPSAGWTDVNGRYIAVTWGSSTCAPVVESSEVTGADAVTLTFAAQPADKPCTMDMVPRAVIAIADGLADQPNAVLTLTGPDFPEAKTVILGENHVVIPLG